MEPIKNGLGGVIDLAENLVRTFKDKSCFEEDEEGNYGAIGYELPYEIDDLLITGDGRCNWDAIAYVTKTANVKIGPGDRDSFGWLTGVIEPMVKPDWVPKDKDVYIVYG